MPYILLLFTLAIFTVGVHGAGLFLDGEHVVNHSAIYQSRIGEFVNNSLLCSTESRLTLASSSESSSESQYGWHYPNGSLVRSTNSGDSIFFSSTDVGVYRLHRVENSGFGGEGIYWCVIPDNNGVPTTLYIGLFQERGDTTGVLQLTRSITFSLLNENPPIFSLTCITTGGPATHVSWVKDDEPIPVNFETTETVTDAVLSTYSSQLKVIGVEPGLYTFRATNNIIQSCTSPPKVTTSAITIHGIDKPTLFSAEQNDSTSILVKWKISDTRQSHDITGFRIFVNESDSNVTGHFFVHQHEREHTLDDLITGKTYVITMITLSNHLPSEPVTPISVQLMAKEENKLADWKIGLIVAAVVVVVVTLVIITTVILVKYRKNKNRT